MDEMTLTLNSPITEEQWDMIEDVDFNHTDSITFYTKHGKEVEFVKRKTGKWTRSRGIYCDRAWCSNCSSAFPIDPNHPFKTPMNWKYCPDCGCRMMQEGEDNDGD